MNKSLKGTCLVEEMMQNDARRALHIQDSKDVNDLYTQNRHRC